jgi:CheY-like chemotaxis protein
VLMDLQLPQLDGYETTRELLRIVHARGVKPPPVIALSAHALSDTFARSREAGCTLQLTKPIRKRVLLETLARVCGARISDAPVAVSGRTTKDDLKPLQPKYLVNQTNNVGAIRAALRRSDLAIISTLAHNMRGSGTSYGFPELSELAMRLEDAAKAQALSEVSALADELEEIVTALQARVDTPRKKSGTHMRAQSIPDSGEVKPNRGSGQR